VFAICSRDLTLTKADKKRFEAFEVWIWRRMLKISWKEERGAMSTVWQCEHRWIERVLSNKVLLQEIIERRVKSKAY